MAKRLRTRLSAGAALVTGIGMMGIATAVPAHAAATLDYTCTTGDIAGSQTYSFTFDTDAKEETAVGEELTITPSGSVTINEPTLAGLESAGITTLEGTLDDVVAVVSDGTNSADVTTNLTIPSTDVNDEANTLSMTGDPATVTPEQPGEYTISTPDTFSATLTGSDADGNQVGSPTTLNCTYAEGSGSQVINTVTVTEDGGGDDGDDGTEEPVEANDWFTEPPSLPLVDNTFTIEGEATQAGVITVEVLSGVPGEDGESTPGEILKTYTMNATEGANTAEYDLVEGADYVRLVSQDCVDEAGNDETVAGGCNVTYKAPWAEDGNNDSDDAGDDAGEKVTDDAPAEPAAPADPQVPQVVQTDGLTPATTPQDDNTAALALGGLLLAGAGAGTVLVARRRAVQH
ncbi:MAG: DUF6801 domain-containing protein [Janibacter sp.]